MARTPLASIALAVIYATHNPGQRTAGSRVPYYTSTTITGPLTQDKDDTATILNAGRLRITAHSLYPPYSTLAHSYNSTSTNRPGLHGCRGNHMSGVTNNIVPGYIASGLKLEPNAGISLISQQQAPTILADTE